MTHSGTTRIFGREYAPGAFAAAIGADPLKAGMFEASLDEIEDKGNEAARAIACNIRADDRVSNERARALVELIDPTDVIRGVPPEWARYALQKYWPRAMRKSNPAHFAEPANADNVVFPPSSSGAAGQGEGHSPTPLAPGLRLASVVDIGGLGMAFMTLLAQEGGDAALLRGCDFDNRPERGAVCAWLDRWLQPDGDGRPTNQQRSRDIQRLAVLAMNASSGRPYFFPPWAALATELAPILEEAPTRWMECLGLGHLGRIDELPRPTWLMVVEYTVTDTLHMARPTQLDAGDNEWHYPSPAGLPPARGGHPLDLGAAPSGLRTELIHLPIAYDADTDVRGDSLRRVDPPAWTPSDAREAHDLLLRHHYLNQYPRWFFECPRDRRTTR